LLGVLSRVLYWCSCHSFLTIKHQGRGQWSVDSAQLAVPGVLVTEHRSLSTGFLCA
jgi:hypothetical protein